MTYKKISIHVRVTMDIINRFRDRIKLKLMKLFSAKTNTNTNNIARINIDFSETRHFYHDKINAYWLTLRHDNL